MPMQRAIEVCVGKDGDRAPLRDYIRTHAPSALDGLRELRGSALDLAVEKLASDFARWRSAPREAGAAPACASRAPGAAHVRIEETALRGISVRQLRAFIAEAYERCEAEAWTSTAPGRSGEVLTAETMTLYDLAEHVIKPLAAKTGLSVVETLADGPQPPAWFVSHWWGETLADFLKCLDQHRNDRNLGEDATYYWVCAYALRQSALGDELSGGVGVSPFMRALQLTDGTVSVLDQQAVAISRAWCALELYETILGRGVTFLHDIYTAHEHTAMYGVYFSARSAVGLVDGLAAADNLNPSHKSGRESSFPAEALDGAKHFALSSAKATEPADLAAIKLQVGGGEPLLDATVRARFGVARLPALLRVDAGDDEHELRALLDDLRASQLRKLSALFDRPRSDASVDLCASLPGSLQELSLDYGAPAIVPRLCELIAGVRLPLLRTLSLSNVKLGVDSAVILAKTVAGGCPLRDLGLESNTLGDEAGVALGEALEVNGTLTALHLANNKLGDEAGIALGKALEVNGTLTALHLASNKLGDEAGIALGKALEVNRTLTDLGLAYNELGDKAGFAHAKALEHNGALTALFLTGNTLIGEEAKAALRNVKAGSSTLKALYIDDFTAKASESDYDDLA